MTRTKMEYEQQLVAAFNQGMNAGYGVDHSDFSQSEQKARNEYMQDAGFDYSYRELFGDIAHLRERETQG